MENLFEYSALILVLNLEMILTLEPLPILE
jgi:hypothetical protein